MLVVVEFVAAAAILLKEVDNKRTTRTRRRTIITILTIPTTPTNRQRQRQRQGSQSLVVLAGYDWFDLLIDLLLAGFK